MSLLGTGDEPRTRANWSVGPRVGFRAARVRVGALDEDTRPGSGHSGPRLAVPVVSWSGVGLGRWPPPLALLLWRRMAATLPGSQQGA